MRPHRSTNPPIQHPAWSEQCFWGDLYLPSGTLFDPWSIYPYSSCSPRDSAVPSHVLREEIIAGECVDGFRLVKGLLCVAY